MALTQKKREELYGQLVQRSAQRVGEMIERPSLATHISKPIPQGRSLSAIWFGYDRGDCEWQCHPNVNGRFGLNSKTSLGRYRCLSQHSFVKTEGLLAKPW
jgi:hypothetical protein